MLTAILIAGAIILTAAALDHAYNVFDDDDDEYEVKGVKKPTTDKKEPK